MAEKKYIIDNAELMAEWNWEKNDKLGFKPNEITSHSGKKVWWICVNGLPIRLEKPRQNHARDNFSELSSIFVGFLWNLREASCLTNLLFY